MRAMVIAVALGLAGCMGSEVVQESSSSGLSCSVHWGWADIDACENGGSGECASYCGGEWGFVTDYERGTCSCSCCYGELQ
jgi:hypothetical protein